MTDYRRYEINNWMSSRKRIIHLLQKLKYM